MKRHRPPICWLYRWRIVKHYILYLITKDIIHWWEVEHYYYSRIHTGIKVRKRKQSGNIR
jgi:hypothetical protein